jgi:hypothetical protein
MLCFSIVSCCITCCLELVWEGMFLSQMCTPLFLGSVLVNAFIRHMSLRFSHWWRCWCWSSGCNTKQIAAIFRAENGGSMFHWNVSMYLKVPVALQPKIPTSALYYMHITIIFYLQLTLSSMCECGWAVESPLLTAYFPHSNVTRSGNVAGINFFENPVLL